MSKLCIEIINFYQRFLSFDTGVLRVLAPGGACRYYPTCSEYTKISIQQDGILRGSWKGIKRIVSCF